MSDELEFLESDIEEGGNAFPYMLSKVADLLRGCEAAISAGDGRTEPARE